MIKLLITCGEMRITQSVIGMNLLKVVVIVFLKHIYLLSKNAGMNPGQKRIANGRNCDEGDMWNLT